MAGGNGDGVVMAAPGVNNIKNSGMGTDIYLLRGDGGDAKGAHPLELPFITEIDSHIRKALVDQKLKVLDDLHYSGSTDQYPTQTKDVEARKKHITENKGSIKLVVTLHCNTVPRPGYMSPNHPHAKGVHGFFKRPGDKTIQHVTIVEDDPSPIVRPLPNGVRINEAFANGIASKIKNSILPKVKLKAIDLPADPMKEDEISDIHKKLIRESPVAVLVIEVYNLGPPLKLERLSECFVAGRGQNIMEAQSIVELNVTANQVSLISGANAGDRRIDFRFSSVGSNARRNRVPVIKNPSREGFIAGFIIYDTLDNHYYFVNPQFTIQEASDSAQPPRVIIGQQYKINILNGNVLGGAIDIRVRLERSQTNSDNDRNRLVFMNHKLLLPQSRLSRSSFMDGWRERVGNKENNADPHFSLFGSHGFVYMSGRRYNLALRQIDELDVGNYIRAYKVWNPLVVAGIWENIVPGGAPFISSYKNY